MDENYIPLIRASLESCPDLCTYSKSTGKLSNQSNHDDDQNITSQTRRKKLAQIEKQPSSATNKMDYLTFEEHETKTMDLSWTDTASKAKKRKKKQPKLVVVEHSNKAKRDKRLQESKVNVKIKQFLKQPTDSDNSNSDSEVVNFQHFSKKYDTEETQHEQPADRYFNQIFGQCNNNSYSEDEHLPIKRKKVINKTKIKSDKPASPEDSSFVVEDISTQLNTINITQAGLGDNSTSNLAELEDIAEKCFVLLKDSRTNTRFIALKANCSIHYYGAITLKVVYGELEVFGAVLNNSSGAVNLYSPRGTTLLYLRNIFSKRHDISIINKEFGVSKLEFDLSTATIFTYEPIKAALVNFVNNYSPHILYPSSKVMFSPKGDYNRLTINENWNDIVELIGINTKLMIIGGKSVGKSTLLRFTINRLLNKHGRVRVIDLDPGQSEFTVPGCVSVVTVSQQVFGPSYTHLHKTDISILSNINISNDVKTYVKSVQKLLNFYNTLEQLPTVINYMGFSQDIGDAIFATCCTICSPQYVVQIQSKYANRNFKQSITVANVKSNLLPFMSELDVSQLDFQVIEVDSVAENNDAWTAEPRQARELAIFAYFSKMAEDVEYINSSNLKMQCISLSDIEIKDLEGHRVSSLAVNANLVALCSHFQDDLYQCYGYGIVRGIDLESNTLVLLTPEDNDTLENVYSLVVGSVTLPPALLMAPGDVTGVMPYVNSGELTTFGQFVKRSYLPVNKTN